MKHSNSLQLLFWLGLPIVMGCGSGLVDVKARATLDGQPIEGATITLVRTESSDGQGRSASGSTDANGIASFTTYAPGDGVPPGKYKVCVIKTSTRAATVTGPPPEIPQTLESEEDFKRYVQAMSEYTSPMREGVPHVQTSLPRIYAIPTTTPLSCLISSKNREIMLELKGGFPQGNVN